MRISKINPRSNAGDTIVEVLIALAIISLVITVSFATSQRALKIGQSAQERTEALKIAESQVETLKAMRAQTTSPNIYTAVNTFCVDPSTVSITGQSPMTTVTVLNSYASPVGSNQFHNNCRKGFDSRYFIAITRDDVVSGGKTMSTFTVRVLWYGLIENSNNGIQELNIVYNLHRDQT